MINNQDRHDKELEAIQLIDRAEELANEGKGEESINVFEKAAQIYLDLGSYIKLDELFIKISNVISQFKNNIQAVYRLRSIIRKTEELKLDEITAKLLIQLGNLSYKMQDWETAGDCYQRASDYLYDTDSKEYYNLSSLLLLKAGQTYERSSIRKDLGKRLILRAIMKINKFDELYEMEEKRGLVLIAMKEYEPAANKFYDIANFFREALNNLANILNESESKDTLINARARFLHFVAEYQTVSALCLRASENRAYNDRIKNLGQDSIELFKQSITLLKQHLFSIKTDFNKEILLRITFDMMILAIIQEMLGKKQLDPLEFLLKNSEGCELLVKKLKETPYYKITERIQKVGIRDSLEHLLKINLGHFEKIKNTLISYFL